MKGAFSKKTCEFLKTLKIGQIIEKVSLCLGVFDKIEVATIGIDEATIALAFQSSLIARSLNLALVFKPFITFGFGVNGHCQRKGFSQMFTPRFCVDYFWNAQQLTLAVNFDFSIFRVLQRSLPAKS